MTEGRIAQILETEIVSGYVAAKITAAGAEVKTVKATPGKVARIKVITGAINVTPTDGVTAVWDALTNAAELDLGGTPMKFSTSIKLAFDGAGTAWILYK